MQFFVYFFKVKYRNIESFMRKNQRSVLFICVDQWRYDYFGFMKHRHSLTPNIDKLARKSSVFKSHFAGIVPCGPSRTTMLTGLYPFIHRSVTNGTPLDKRFTNIAKEVRKIGYVPKLYGYRYLMGSKIFKFKR